MPGVIEDMPFEARVSRMQEIAVALVALVTQRGSLAVMDALQELALQLRTGISQVKYGLNYALSLDWVVLDNDTLIPA